MHTRTHFTILIANMGSLFVWTGRPRKIIQNLAPGFHEVERNIYFVPAKTNKIDQPMEDVSEKEKEE